MHKNRNFEEDDSLVKIPVDGSWVENLQKEMKNVNIIEPVKVNRK